MCPDARAPSTTDAGLPELGGFMLPRVQRLLAAAPLPVLPPQSAPRSPLGAHALRLRPARAERAAADCESLAGWLQSCAWVEQLALRPPHVYLRPQASAAGEWVQAGMAERLRLLRSRLDTAAAPEDGRPGTRSLHQFRIETVATAWQRLCVALGRPALPPPAVEGLDVPQGTLRARAGGSVSLQDVISALQALMRDWPGGAPGASLALRFFLLRWPRGQRVLLTDARLAESQRALALLCRDAGEPPSVVSGGAAAARRRGELAATVDQLDAALQRALEQQDPCPLLRHVLQVAEALDDAHPVLAADDGMRQAAGQAIAAGLDLCGLADLPAPPCPYRSPQPPFAS